VDPEEIYERADEKHEHDACTRTGLGEGPAQE